MKSIYNETIFLAGKTSDGREHTIDNLSTIVKDTHTAIKYGLKIPIKIGHNDKSEIADGWVDNIRLSDNAIKADFLELGEETEEHIRNGKLPSKSIELIPFICPDGIRLEEVVAAVALLGKTTPSLPWLRDTAGSLFSYSTSKATKHLGTDANRAGEAFTSLGKTTPYSSENGFREAKKRIFTVANIDETNLEYFTVRIMNPDEFNADSFRTVDMDNIKGIYAICGTLRIDSSDEVQAYRFDKDKWSIADVANWLTAFMNKSNNVFIKDVVVDNNYEPYSKIKENTMTLDKKEDQTAISVISVESFGKLNQENIALREKFELMEAADEDWKKKFEELEAKYKILLEKLQKYEEGEEGEILSKAVEEGKVLEHQVATFRSMFKAQGFESTSKFIAELPVTNNLSKNVTTEKTGSRYEYVNKDMREDFTNSVECFGLAHAKEVFSDYITETNDSKEV